MLSASRVAQPAIMPTPVSLPDLNPILSPGVPNQWTADPPAADRTASFPERDQAGNALILERRECDYPHAAKFWTKRKFDISQKEEATIPGAVKGRQGPGRLKLNNENVSMQFVIDAHGHSIDGDRAQAIRAEMRSWFRGCKDLPKSWKNGSSVEMRRALYLHMYKTFPELQLANYDWKVEQIAIDVFAQLAAANRKAAKKEKSSKAARGRKSRKRARELSSEPESVGPVDLNDAGYLMLPEYDQQETTGSTTIGSSHSTSVETPHKRHHSGPGPATVNNPSLTSPVVSLSSPLPVDDVPLRSPIPFSAPSVHLDALDNTPSSVLSATNPLSQAGACTEENANESSPPEVQPEEPTPASIDVNIPKEVYTISNPLWTALEGVASSGPLPSPSPPPNPGPSKPAKTLKKTMAHVWPPTPSNTKPKPVCARIWCKHNPDGTEEMFEVFYKQMSQYHRKKYIACDGNVPATAGGRKAKTEAENKENAA
ncbi:hypothetical protein GSI_12740 [Ganoderma sinense ZZ0214-1]|uniref:Uncharacterized protein n=1 Tax=Ganoderma sinense ZZ0214-1 TaxID=1077348 RepID=A0A2G8RTP9_9APHY|nr:hypothetical protein GSI_12740 [Ganoderma sinense ZZ0214-1]